jgi:hypothetical protein
LIAPEPLRASTLYSVDSRLTLREGRYLLREPPPAELRAYLQAEGISARVRELAHAVSAGAGSRWAQALALERHLRTHYAYTYETAERQNYTPLDWFLFDARRGHCEYFASALAMMLRVVGIPSRLATGFALTTPNPITGFHEVRALDGHAWVEAYVDGAGWLMLEPTPFYPLPLPRPERSVAEQLDRYLERRAETRALLEPEQLVTQLMILARDGWQSLRVGQRTLSSAVSTVGWLLPLIIAALIAGLAAYLLAIAATDWLDNLQIRRSLRRLPAVDDRAAMLLAAAALLRMTTPRSFARRPDWSLREYADELARAAAANPRVHATGLGEFIEAFEAARYGSSADCNAAASLPRVIDLIRVGISSHRWPRLQVAIAKLERVWPGPLLKRSLRLPLHGSGA